MATLCFGQTPSYISTTGLVGWWPFNGNAIDESSNTNNGTVNGATLTTDRNGIANSAYTFDGINDYISLPNIVPVQTGTISFWCLTNSTLAQILVYSSNVIGNGFGSSNANIIENHTAISAAPTLGSVFIFDNSAGNVYYDPTPFVQNQWSHMAVAYNNTNAYCYINGALVQVMDISSETGNNQPTMTYIGRPGTSERFLNGKFDDLAIWNRVLTPCEISDLYHSQLNWLQVSAGNDLNTCIGNSVTLSGLGNSSQYTWNNGATNNLPFTPTISGSTSYTVTGTDPSGCVAIDVSTVTVNPIPLVNAGIDQTVCTGNTVTLSGNGATTYSWNNGVSNGVGFNPTVSNDYIVIGTDINGCTGLDTMNVSVNNPTSSILTETALDSYTLNGQTYTQSGTYTQVIPNELGCDSTITLDLTLQYTGIEELKNDILVYPNPSASYLTIESNWIQNEEFVILDMQGREIKKGIFSTSKEKIDLKNVAIGNYILRIGAKEIKISKE